MEDLSFLDAVASTGCVVSLAHKAAMQSSFPLLKKQNKAYAEDGVALRAVNVKFEKLCKELQSQNKGLWGG